MEVAILSAGEGSRLGFDKRLPKSFVEISGATILSRQLECLRPFIVEGTVNSTVHLVLGYGFENDPDPESTVRSLADVPDEISLNCLVLPYWRQTENAASALAAVPSTRDDLLLFCGDVVFTHSLLGRVIDEYQEKCTSQSYSAVAAIEGVQDERTAVRWNEDRVIHEYGAIKGHQEAGIFVLNSDHFDVAGQVWIEGAKSEWFPIVFEEIPTRAVLVSSDDHGEVNTQEQLKSVRQQFDPA